MRDDDLRSPGRPSSPIPRSRLLSIARDTFAETGYAAASLAQIAERAGIRKASLFHHFPSKLALYLEAVAEMVQELHVQVVEAGMRRGSLAERLDRLGETVVRYLGTHRSAARLLLREMVEGGPFLQSPEAAVVMTTLDDIVALLEEGATDEHLHPNATRHRALSIVGLHLFYFAAAELAGHALGGEIFTPEAVEERARAVSYQVRRIVGLRLPGR